VEAVARATVCLGADPPRRSLGLQTFRLDPDTLSHLLRRFIFAHCSGLPIPPPCRLPPTRRRAPSLGRCRRWRPRASCGPPTTTRAAGRSPSAATRSLFPIILHTGSISPARQPPAAPVPRRRHPNRSLPCQPPTPDPSNNHPMHPPTDFIAPPSCCLLLSTSSPFPASSAHGHHLCPEGNIRGRSCVAAVRTPRTPAFLRLPAPRPTPALNLMQASVPLPHKSQAWRLRTRIRRIRRHDRADTFFIQTNLFRHPWGLFSLSGEGERLAFPPQMHQPSSQRQGRLAAGRRRRELRGAVPAAPRGGPGERAAAAAVDTGRGP